MTREELHTEVATLTGEIVGMVSDLSPFDYKRKAEIDKEILALFDRYEREQKANGVVITVSEPDARELLAWGKRIVALQEMAVQASKEPFGPALAHHVLPSNEMYRRFIAAIERELPPGPEGGK